MLLDLRSLLEQAQANTGSCTYQVTVPTCTGSVHQSTGTCTATYGVTVPTCQGTVVNPAVQNVGNGGPRIKPRPRVEPPVYEWPKLEAPTYRIGGTARVTYAGPSTQAQGVTGHVVFSGVAAIAHAPARVQAIGGLARRRVNGTVGMFFPLTQVQVEVVYDRSLRDQIEEEDQWLADVVSVLSQAA